MRNRWTAVVVVIGILLFAMAACGKNETELNESQSQTETQEELNQDSEINTTQQAGGNSETDVPENEQLTNTQNDETEMTETSTDTTSETEQGSPDLEQSQTEVKPKPSESNSSKPGKEPSLSEEPSESEEPSLSEDSSPSEKPSTSEEPSPSEEISTSQEESSVTEEPSESVEEPSQSEQKPSESDQPSVPETKPSEPSESEKPNSSESNPLTEKYMVTVKSKGGYGLYNVKIHVYANSAKSELVLSSSTNGNGVAILELVPSDDYVISLSNVPEGYNVKSSYVFKGKSAYIALESKLITDKDILSTKLDEGDVMYDFSVTNAEGKTLTLSEILKDKKMVMLNFWYVNCAFCVAEFPYMSSAYEKYADDVEIIALNPFDSMEAVNTFLDENPLPFEVATCPVSLPGVFGVQAYPVSIVIDRYGVIREIETAAILEESGFVQLFNKYTR